MSDAPIPLWKQCLGAVVGAAAALVLYGGFALVMDQLPSVGAIVTSTLPAQPVEETASSAAPGNVQDIVRRAREIAAQNLAKENQPSIAESDGEMDEDMGDDIAMVTDKKDVAAVSYKVLPVPGIVSTSSSSSSAGKNVQTAPKVAATVTAAHTGAPVKASTTEGGLPSTGVGLWAGALVAMAAASVLHRNALAAHLRRLRA